MIKNIIKSNNRTNNYKLACNEIYSKNGIYLNGVPILPFIPITPYINQFTVCASIDVTNIYNITQLLVTGDGNGADYNMEGVWVTCGGNVTTSGVSVGYASSITPTVNNTFNGNPTNASTNKLINDGSYNELTGTWTNPESGLNYFEINSMINIARITGTGERSYYIRILKNGSPTNSCSNTVDFGGNNEYHTLINKSIVQLNQNDIINVQISQVHPSGTTVQNMRFTFYLSVQKIN